MMLKDYIDKDKAIHQAPHGKIGDRGSDSNSLNFDSVGLFVSRRCRQNEL